MDACLHIFQNGVTLTLSYSRNMCWEAKEAITWLCTSPGKPYLGVPHTHTVEAGGMMCYIVNARCSLPHKTPSAALVASWKEMYVLPAAPQ